MTLTLFLYGFVFKVMVSLEPVGRICKTCKDISFGNKRQNDFVDPDVISKITGGFVLNKIKKVKVFRSPITVGVVGVRAPLYLGHS